jgi:hypothetical protein
MRAIKIDVEKKQVYEIDLMEGLQPIYDAIGCTTFECPVRLGNMDTIYVDEEALLKPVTSVKGGFFFGKKSHHAFIGNGLITGTDEEEETISALSSLEYISHHIEWMTDRQILACFQHGNAGFIPEPKLINLPRVK